MSFPEWVEPQWGSWWRLRSLWDQQPYTGKQSLLQLAPHTCVSGNTTSENHTTRTHANVNTLFDEV